jgi:hypothetical protein
MQRIASPLPTKKISAPMPSVDPLWPEEDTFGVYSYKSNLFLSKMKLFIS